jgi:hypothetical protein
VAEGFLLATVNVALCAAAGAEPGYETVTEHDFLGPSATPAHRFELITNPAVEGVFDKATASALVDLLPSLLVIVTFCDEPAVNTIGPGVPLALDDGLAVNIGAVPAHAETASTSTSTTIRAAVTDTERRRPALITCKTCTTITSPSPGS